MKILISTVFIRQIVNQTKALIAGYLLLGMIVIEFICIPSEISAGNNLIKNPGFEEPGNQPQYWTISGPLSTMQPLTSIDSKTSFSGKFSLKMQSSNPNCHGFARQVVDIKDNQTYLFSVYFKTNGVKSMDKSVLIRVKWLKDGNSIGYNYIYTYSEQKNGWFLASNKIKALEGATQIEISLVFRWGTGTVWWDDISVEPYADVPPRNVKVGTVYCRPSGKTVEDNIKQMSALIDQAGNSGCQIICLPEGWATYNTGIGMKKHEANTLAGSASRMLKEKAKEYGMYIVSGLYNWVGDTLYNVAVLYGRNGKIEGIFKKIQLPDAETEAGIVPGSSFPVFETDFGTIGMLVCWDYAFPEVARNLALNGAEILFCPIAGDVRGEDTWKIIARARAVDNGVYFVTAIYDGHSVIVNPAGDVLKESGEQNALIMETVDLNFIPPWDWIGNEGRGDWKGVWRKDRRADLYGKALK
ncbi:MAG: nitrilase-related carbon-nitrogen hydrolase [Bacteroidales bacterium]